MSSTATIRSCPTRGRLGRHDLPHQGRPRHDGIIEIYANGRFIARATGTIGVFGAEDPTQYFRFGHNRAPMPGTATIYIDRFRRGASKMDVEQ
jgi:hypothetical protein